MKRQRQLPDKRLNWRDPNMPVMRTGIMSNDPPDTKPYVMTIDKDTIKRYHQWSLQNTIHYPDYRNDPSYWWSKKK